MNSVTTRDLIRETRDLRRLGDMPTEARNWSNMRSHESRSSDSLPELNKTRK